jgi:ElaB/YqjD/DUF883 family membrane-anchored ribosome-binding protein
MKPEDKTIMMTRIMTRSCVLTWAAAVLALPAGASANPAPSPNTATHEKPAKSPSKQKKFEQPDKSTIQQRIARIESELKGISKDLADKATEQTESSRTKIKLRVDALTAELEISLKELGKTSSDKAEETRQRIGDFLKGLGERLSEPEKETGADKK